MIPHPSAPTLIAIAGIPGSGKTTIGRAVATELGAALLDLDTLTNPLVRVLADQLGAGDNFDHPALRGAVREARYRSLKDAAADVASAGISAVVVAPFTTELAEAAAWQAFSAGAQHALLIEVRIDPSSAAQRRAARGLPRDLAGSGQVTDLPAPSTVAHLAVDGTQPVEDSVAAIVAAVRAQG